MNAIIIDDEINAIKSLRWELEHFVPEVNVLATFESAINALDYLKKNQSPDLVFLDVEMPQMNGFEFIKNLTERNFEIIFTTAYSEFALEALKNEAIDYLLKPIDSDDLIKAIEKVKKRAKNHSFSQKIEDTLKEFNDTKGRIRINHDGKVDFIEPHEIIYIASEGNYCRIFFEDRKEVLVTSKLKEVYEELPIKYFFRIHKSYVINVSKITSYYKNQQYIELSNDISLPLARARKKDFVEKYL